MSVPRERPMGNLPVRRLFYALWPDDALRQRIHAQTRDIVSESRGRPTSITNLHVTLAFLGEVAEERLPAVLAAGAQVSAPAFDLEFDAVQTFKRSGVLVLTVQTVPPALLGLVEQLRLRLLEAQFNLRPEDYRPHVTLARDVRQRMERRSMSIIRWHVREFALVQSQPGRGGSAYSVIQRWLF